MSAFNKEGDGAISMMTCSGLSSDRVEIIMVISFFFREYEVWVEIVSSSLRSREEIGKKKVSFY